MLVLGVLGFVLAMFVILKGSMKGYHIIALTFLASLILAVTNQMPLQETLWMGEDSFVGGVSSFVSRYFVIFLLSAVLAQYIEKSGAAQSIARFILSKTGTDRPYFVLLAVFIFASVLTLGGVNLFVAMFVIVPLSRNLFKQANLSWKLFVTPYMMGVGTFTMSTFPGSPSIQNVIMSDILGTSLTAAPIYSLILTLFFIVFTLWRMKVELNESLARCEGFEDRFDREDEEERDHYPSFIRAIAPLASLFLTIIIGSIVKLDQVIIYALALSVLVSAILLHPYISSPKEVLNQAAVSSVTSVMAPAVTLGFGNVMSEAPAFNQLMTLLQKLPISPLLSLIVITALLQFIIGSASGVLTIVGEKFIPLYDLSAYNMNHVHRLLATTPAFMPPHVGAYLSFQEISGLNYQDSYKQVMISLNGGTVLAVILGYVMTWLFG